MPTILRCPDCNALLRIHDAHLGRVVRCPKCDTAVRTRSDGELDAPPLPETRIESPTTVDHRRPKPGSSQTLSPRSGENSDPGLTSRRSVSIPLELFRQMARETEIDWNRVAVEAFEQKLSDLAKLAETAHPTDFVRPQEPTRQKSSEAPSSELAGVIDRLRASRNSMKSKGHPEGFAAGQEWARSKADVADLIALERFRNGMLDREWNTFFQFNNTIFTYAEALVMSIHPQIENTAGAKRFWVEAIGEKRDEDLDNPVFLKGFAEGALAIWQSVKDAL